MNVVRFVQFLRRFAVQRLAPEIHAARKIALLSIATSLILSASNSRSYSQDIGASTYSRNKLIALARQMRERPENTDNAKNGLFEHHLDSTTILAVRTRSGRAELHAASADTFFVIQGHATLTTGGTIINPRGIGEVRGDSVLHGLSTELGTGDVVHIPADTPHQLLLAGSDPFVYVLVKTLVR
jgi:mannose-6-phosphate isomerase-like protein (cupin superfamily)